MGGVEQEGGLMQNRLAQSREPEAPGPVPQKRTTDLYANAEALNQGGAAGYGQGAERRPAPPDSFQLDSAPITKSDLMLVLMIPAVFFLGFLFGRTRRSFERSYSNINRSDF